MDPAPFEFPHLLLCSTIKRSNRWVQQAQGVFLRKKEPTANCKREVSSEHFMFEKQSCIYTWLEGETIYVQTIALIHETTE